MAIDKEVAVLDERLDNFDKSQARQTETLDKILAQTQATNGRVNTLEANEKNVKNLHLSRRLAAIERWKYGVTAVCTIALLFGGFIFSLILKDSVGSAVKESMDANLKTINTTIKTTVKSEVEKQLSSMVIRELSE